MTMIATLPAMVRASLEPLLPDDLQVRWFTTRKQAFAMAPGSEIGWFDMQDKGAMTEAITLASDMRWLNSLIAGMDGLPLPVLQERGVVVTNGVGINALTIAEYVLMGMLTIAKGYRAVVQAQLRHEWLKDAPGKVELAGSRALILGHGGIGQLVEPRLQAMGVDVTVVRRTPGASTQVLGPDQWRARLGTFDWVILAVPATPETRHMIGAAELAAMKTSAVLINVARGSVVDQNAVVTALQQGAIGAAFLDVTDPEPLPPEHPLWSLDNAHVTMHLSGRSQDRMFERAARRFLDNLARYRAGEPLQHQVDLARGY
jgi:phosphoglycerate dehydrogenase-like enzyme